ncbi:MAG: xylose isomerase [Verrucomicrobiota bacterium]|nr:xylose isomerase [Verrucomicrobiota bacterium]
MKKAPVLKQFANLWTLGQYPTKDKEWGFEEKFKQVAKEGFEAIGGGAWPVAELCGKYGLDYICYIDGNMKTYKERLESAVQSKPARINVQMCDHDTLPAEAVKVWMKMEPVAEKLGLEIDLEVHRDTCTETPEKTYEIADRYFKAKKKKIRLCFDYSHIACVKHLSHPYAPRLLTHPDLVQKSRQVHFRPFNGHHCQIPATNGKGEQTQEFKDYLQFVDAFIELWLKGAKGGEVLYACPEFGPQGGYGISTFPDVWEDACLLRRETETIWKKHLKNWSKKK